MSSGKEIVLFDSVDAEKWIRHVSEVYDLFSKSTEKNKVMLSFDTSIDVDSIKPFHLVSLACLIHYLRNDLGRIVSISKKNNKVFEYIYNELGFHEYWSGGKNHIDTKTSNNIFNLWRIVEEEKDLYAKKVEDYFRNKYFISKDLSAISVSLVEAYYNVFDHAQVKGNAFSIIQYDEKSCRLYVAISDFGIGIAQSVRGFNKDVQTDNEAILMAVQDNFTVGSTVRNRGMGLGNVLAPAIEATLVSHKGWVHKNGGVTQGVECDFWYPGTLISYWVDLSMMEDEEFIEEFSF